MGFLFTISSKPQNDLTYAKTKPVYKGCNFKVNVLVFTSWLIITHACSY